MKPRLARWQVSLSGGSWQPVAVILLLVLTVLPVCCSASSVWTAYVNISFIIGNKTVWQRGEDGVYGLHSLRDTVQGLVLLPQLVGKPTELAVYGCDPNAVYLPPPGVEDWIALVKRGGDCTFSQKIRLATEHGASGVVVFNSDKGDVVIQMSHPETGDTVAIMIGNMKGMTLVDRIQRGVQVSMIIEVGKQHGPLANHYSIFFVSVAFFIVTAATVGYFIFYSARRLRIMRSLNRRQKRLKQDAKKAIGQLQLRTLKQGDPETSPDGDSCAVCIEVYKPNDVVRILTCNHFFHKTCIDPWLLEHRTCPMCKCDILKALGIEVDVEEVPETLQAEESNSAPSAPEIGTYTEQQDSHSETASSGYASVQGVEESAMDEDHVPSEGDLTNLVNQDSTHVTVNVVSQHDNPTFEDEEETRVHEVKS